MCVDYTDLNKASTKDSCSLPIIDQLVGVSCLCVVCYFVNWNFIHQLKNGMGGICTVGNGPNPAELSLIDDNTMLESSSTSIQYSDQCPFA